MKKPIVYIDQLAATNDKLQLQLKDAAELIGLGETCAEKRMKILHVTPFYEPTWHLGGLVRCCSDPLPGVGKEVTVFATGKPLGFYSFRGLNV